MEKEIKKLIITKSIEVGDTVVIVPDNKDITTEVFLYGSVGNVRVVQSHTNGNTLTMAINPADAKLVWQKAQQQQK